ncbi:MAG: site-specific integrase [Erysipelotrichaceae bacterium]|nr:site-specific integrase [Erysipelotrichaceae bacterium]
MIMFRKVKFNTILEEWLQIQKGYVKESTYATYYHHVNKHIKPYFKNMYISKLKHIDIQQFINDMLDHGMLNHQGGLSVKTVKELVNVIKLCLKYAIKDHYIDSFDLEFHFPITNRETQLISDDNCQKLIQYLKKSQDMRCTGILLILCSGIRIGELCALKNNDFDLMKQEVTIHKTLQRIQDIDLRRTKIIINTTKTQYSTRIVPISESLIPYLNIESNEYYFLTQTTKYVEPRALRYFFKRILEELEIPYVTIHSLRHYFASKCIELGFDYNCLSEILGHSSVSTTMNLYVHTKDEYKKACMNKIKI